MNGWRFDNSYARLPNRLFSPAEPARVRAPQLTIFNTRLAEELGLDFTDTSPEQLAALFAGQALPEGAQPIAQAYAGHQFGGFTMLGDGRAILLGEHLYPDGRRVDIQFKGSGPTAYSRRGDGRAAIGPMLREYLISEGLHALGIPSTRSLAVVATGEPVYRERTLPGAILTRVAASHIRVGTFQYVAAVQDEELLRQFANYVISRHDPELSHLPDKYLAFLKQVIKRQAALIAQWQCVGFVHGVMNTDNMTISGETIDYGPCAFLDAYHPETVFSSIDQGGRYAFGNQPSIAQWNLARLAETLLPLLHSNIDQAIEIATAAIQEFPDLYEKHWLSGMRHKIGLTTVEPTDRDLIQELLDWMATERADFTSTFRQLATFQERVTDSDASGDLESQPGLAAWLERWQARLEREGRSRQTTGPMMQRVNPAVIPRNHLVEDALATAAAGDLTVFESLLAAITNPFQEPTDPRYSAAPPAGGPCYRTFCGT